MNKIITLFFAGLSSLGFAQTTAMDFYKYDCAGGNYHHLYDELDSGNVIILEFFMNNCQPCIDAGKALEPMFQHLKATACGNKIRFYQTGFNNTYTCLTVSKWVTNNGFTSVPFDSGAAQVAYYGGFGMPTIAVAAGSAHKILYLDNQNFPASDTAKIDSLISNFCLGTGINEAKNNFSFTVFPKPTSGNFSVSFNATEAGNLKMEMENILGQKIKSLTDEKISAGKWERGFSVEKLPKGIYFLRILFNGKPAVEKIIIE